TRPGTALDPESDTAAEGNLRESEVISPYWQNGENSLKPVRLLGYLFCKDDGRKSEQIQKLQQIQTILLGGDARYGLGKIRWVECKEVTCFFGCPVELNQADPVVQRSRVLAHVPANSVQLQGEYELLAGWDGRNLQSSTQLYWQPGAVSTEPLRWKILDDGYWEKTKQ
ncbi:MAG: hypothetical protein NNA18_05480, partial [Nitrospira sp.]|nr:hypothetical protein [Nitrospira sp.]